MKTMHLHSTVKYALLAGLLGGLGTLNTLAQFTFDCGSDGSYQAMNITTDTTLDLPTNGIFNCTTITIASNATLKFNPNALNTPVYLLATGDVTINGTIDVNGSAGTAPFGGAGGPGGFGGGNPGQAGLPVGDGKGPGAGRGGSSNSGPGGAGYASYGSTGVSWDGGGATNNGAVYGSPLLIPLVGGSGGGGRYDGIAGAGGGGAVLVASNTRITVSGAISATSYIIYAFQGVFGFGSGGAVRLVAPVVGGAGSVNVRGGYDTSYGTSGGAGRIRIDCVDRRSFALACNPAGVTSVGCNMIAMLTNAPRLDITQVATNTISVGAGGPVFFMLPRGADTNQTVTVQATNFGRIVPIRVVLTPDNGSSSSYDTNIDNTTSPATVTVSVVVPVNVQVQVNAWTR